MDDEGKIVFVTNLTPGTTEDDIRRIFSACGAIESVEFEPFKRAEPKQRRSAGTPAQTELALPFQEAKGLLVNARITFETSEGARAAKKSKFEDYTGKFEAPASRGLDQWITAYKAKTNVDANELQKKIDLYMFQFDNKEKEPRKQKEERLEASSTPDADGWIEVTRTGKRPSMKKGGRSFNVATMSQAELLARKAQEKRLEMGDFYKFQRIDEKKKNIEELRARFEQDKKRIEKMKQNRKFKAF